MSNLLPFSLKKVPIASTSPLRGIGVLASFLDGHARIARETFFALRPYYKCSSGSQKCSAKKN
jgi:hypothetical protein